MMFPLEILEIILSKCDGKTLLNARKSCTDLRGIVDYLAEKTRLWEWCCREEIPNEQLVEYLPKYEGCGKEKWLNMYINWYSWEKIEKLTILEPVRCPLNLSKISCVAVSSHHIAIGSEDGRLKIFTQHWRPFFEHRIVAVKITNLTFIGCSDDLNDLDMCLVVAFPNGLSIFAFKDSQSFKIDIDGIKSHSVFRNYICYEKVGGRLTIIKISNLIDRRRVQEIWFARVYSPSWITCYKMWNGTCTFLINTTIKSLSYDTPTITPLEEMQKVTDLWFYAPLMINSSVTKIYRDNVIINVYKNNVTTWSPHRDIMEDYIEIVILDKETHFSKKLFNMLEIFKCNITCIFLYGNLLLIGTDCGELYYYHISNWKNIDLKQYNHRQIVGRHPIIAIAVKEFEKERRFYVSSRFAIHEVAGFMPNVYP
ncbi:uncharacterized protein LOC143205047 isoform X2 [Rhynchophorus ferrugineus]|uniref:F-box domain-containing protein n=1 Tax=Rhynchophorus ferrugineus TaxID=354439 RepID=A0A834IGE8_RHYFE|nr:hypothetical protein GWI33_006221 [Rhynchophorus ferrugineus]